MAFKLNVNGKVLEADVDPDTPLLWTLRDSLGILGPKFGCGVGPVRRLHGAYRRQADAHLRRPRSRPVGAAKVTTIEAMADRSDRQEGAGRLDASSTWPSAATASPARSCRPPRC